MRSRNLWFQSRNRDTFLFKVKNVPLLINKAESFNLVIEILFFSSVSFVVCQHLIDLDRFNLVIEILFFSSKVIPYLQVFMCFLVSIS